MEIGIGIVFLVVGFALLAGAFLLFRNVWRKIRTWTTTLGTVTGFTESMKNRRYFYRPEIAFTAADGRSVVFRSSVGSQRKSYRVGDVVQVLYSQNDPSGATIKSFSALCLPGFFATIFGSCFFCLGLFLILSEWSQ
jgi:hypothetical protein